MLGTTTPSTTSNRTTRVLVRRSSAGLWVAVRTALRSLTFHNHHTEVNDDVSCRARSHNPVCSATSLILSFPPPSISVLPAQISTASRLVTASRRWPPPPGAPRCAGGSVSAGGPLLVFGPPPGGRAGPAKRPERAPPPPLAGRRGQQHAPANKPRDKPPPRRPPRGVDFGERRVTAQKEKKQPKSQRQPLLKSPLRSTRKLLGGGGPFPCVSTGSFLRRVGAPLLRGGGASPAPERRAGGSGAAPQRPRGGGPRKPNEG